MALTREAKEQRVAIFRDVFKAPFFVLTHYSGTSAVHMDQLRSALTKSGASLCVLKNSLAKRALDEDKNNKERHDFLSPFFKGSAVAVAWSHEENFTHIPKIFEHMRKDDCPTLKMIAGCLGNQTFDAEKMQELAALPSLEIVRSGFVALLKAPMTRFARTLHAHSVLLRVFAAKIAKG